MSDIKSTYTMFYDRFVPFTNDISNKLKPDAPGILSSKIGSVARIIRPTDRPFEVHQTDEIVKNVMLTLIVTEAYLKKLEQCSYVKDDESSWFSSEKTNLDFIIAMNKMALANLQLEPDDSQVLEAGLGTINRGVYNSVPREVFEDVKRLISELLTDGC